MSFGLFFFAALHRPANAQRSNFPLLNSLACAQQMAEEIAKNIKDPTLRTWVDPEFSSTTETDRVCSAASLMSIRQKRSSYRIDLYSNPGIPSVTLKGTVEDWQSLRNKIDR